MLITKVTKGPTYNPTTGWLLTVGEVEKVAGAQVSSCASCGLAPQVVGVSGNIVNVKFLPSGVSGTALAVSTVLDGTDFFVVAEGY